MNKQAIKVDHVCLIPSQQIGMHQQATWELSYIIKGRGVRTIGSQSEPFETGDMVLVPPEIPHCWKFGDQETHIENISVMFPMDLLHLLADQIEVMRGIMQRYLNLDSAIALVGKTNEIKRIENLLDKYMDGATSNEEEARLRKYFDEHANDIPEEWESYRALFSYIGFEQMDLSQILKEEKKEENSEKKDIAKENIEKKEEWEILKKKASRSRWLIYFGTFVAAAAIIAFMLVGIQKMIQPQPECYAVIDGKVYTDQEFVHHEALDALEDVSADSEDPFSALDMMRQ